MQYNDSGLRAFPNDYANSTSLEGYRRVALDTSGNLAYASATQLGYGTLEERTIGTDQVGTVRLWSRQGTRFFIASGAIAQYAPFYAAANGKVASTGSIRLGINVGAATTADGDLMEGLPDDALGDEMFVQVAASTALTNTTTQTAFDQSYTFPANSLKAGDIIRVFAQGIATSTNSTDTLTPTLRIGTVDVLVGPAIDVANNDIFVISGDIVIRTAGASGTFVAAGMINVGVPATATSRAAFKASTAIDTTATQNVNVTGAWSVASASNSARLDILNVQHLPRIAD